MANLEKDNFNITTRKGKRYYDLNYDFTLKSIMKKILYFSLK